MYGIDLSASQIAWWGLTIAIVIVAIIAIVFAVLAFGESQVSKPYRNIVRHDIIAKGDLVVDGDSKINDLDAEGLVVHKSSILKRTRITNFGLNEVVSLTNNQGGVAIPLDIYHSVVRIDSPLPFRLQLPPVASVPGQVFQIMKSQLAASAVVEIDVADGDFICGSGVCTPNGSISLASGIADQIWISNDFINSWKAF